MDTARSAAVKAVVRIHKGGWANLTAKSAFAALSLSSRDKAFASALFYGTCERLVTLDAALRPLSKRPLEKLDVEVRAILETGLYQLHYMQVPPSAAVNESVKLARKIGKSSAAGFVNAVLRKAAALDLENLPYETETQRVMLRYSVSEAVAKAIMAALPGEYDAFLAACFGRPELCLRVNTLKITPGELAARLEDVGGETRPGQLPGALYARLPGGVAEEAMFRQGLYHVQGEASQFACANLQVRPGERVLDVCAAPGGKSATLAEELGGGTGLTACDVRENRVELIQATLARLHIQGANVLQNDGAVYNPALEGQDAVLCDVPCSGLGVLAKKPDMRLAGGENYAALPALQLKILSTSARYVKQGGRLVYSTCTIRSEENEEVVRAFLQENPAFSLISPPFVPKGAQCREKMLPILPHQAGLDGFFVACLARLW